MKYALATIPAGPVELGVRIAGDRSKPALVLLHGWPHCHAIYAGVIDELAADRFVLAFDLPGTGASRGSPPSSKKMVLADIVLLGAERLGARSIVVAGLDVGGMIAYAAARDHAERIAGAVVMNTVIPGIEPWSKVIADPRIWHFAFHAISGLPETLVAGRERLYFDFFVDFLSGDPGAITGDMRAAFAAAYAHPAALTAGFDWYRAFAPDARRNEVAKKIETPMLYLRGDADGRSIEEYAEGLRRAGVANLKHETVPGGEISPLESPTAFVKAVRRFCSTCE